MSCSEARRLANQRNAQKSTGPKTEAGKLVARLNSLTHGMRSEHGLVPPHLTDAVAKHHKMLTDAYHPSTDHQSWLLEQVADAAARLDYCQFMIRAELDDMADRADLCWDEDRKRAAEEIAARIPKDPGRTASRLRETEQGCRWILARWDALSVSLSETKSWDETQCNLAAHLMGVGPDLRPSHPTLDPSANPDDQTALMYEQIDDLNLLLDALEPLNDKERELTRMGFPLRPSKELLRFERYETKLRKVYTEALHAFRTARAESFPQPEPLTALEPPPLIEPAVITSNKPDFESRDDFDSLDDLEPMPTPSPEFLADKPVFAMLAEMVGAIQARRAESEPDEPPAVSPPSKVPNSPPPLNRRARRAQAKEARKSKSAVR